MPKHIALPCPSEPIVAHHRPALDIIARVRHHPERVELEHIPPELLEEARPRYAQEGSNACVAYEVRDVWIPTLRTSNISTSTELLQSPPKDKKKKEGGDSRACHLVCKRKGTLHRCQVEQMNRNDKVIAKSFHTPPFNAPITRNTAPQPRHVVLKQPKQLRARRLRSLPTATSHDEGQARGAGVLDARFVCSRTWEKRTGIVWAVL